MKDKQDKISQEYSKAINDEENTIVSNTGNARFADYSDTKLDQLQQEMLKDSFGCGNPLAYSQVSEGQVVLDLGCGAGLDLLLAAEKVGASGKVIGVDINKDMLERARQNIKASGFETIELRKGTIENLPVGPGSVDWIISNCVINLSVDKQQTFSEIARVLTPGGRILISDIVAENLPWWMRRSGILSAACGGSVISEKRYLEGLKAAGLKECKVIARQHYAPSQLAAIVNESLPSFLQKLSFGGKGITKAILIKLATPIANNLWSAKISGTLSPENAATNNA